MRTNGPHFNRITIAGVFSAMVLLLLVSCGSGEPGSGFTSGAGGSFALSCSSPFAGPGCTATQGGGAVGILPTCNDDQTGIIDACGVTITTPIDRHDPVAMTVTGLTANTRHAIVITDPDTPPVEITPVGGLIAIADSTGAINKATIVQNMSSTALLGDYTVTITEEGGGGTPQTLTYTLADLGRVQCVDSGGTPTASFLSSENVFAKVDKNSGTLADGNYDVYVLSDLQKPLADGGLISGTPAAITVASGTGTIDLGTPTANNYAPGGYDVVVDVNGNGIFNQGTDLISRHNRLLPCFSVQAASGVAVQQIASDKNGNKREIFDPNANIAAIRDIQAFLTPTERSADTTPGAVDTYLVAHQGTWTNGDAITDASSTGAKRSPVQNDSNSEAPWVIVPYTFLASLGGGATSCFDVVVDTDKDGVFTAGTDYVDNIDHLGNTTCGVRISTASCSSNVSFNGTAGDGSTLDDGATTTDTAINISGTISGTPSETYLTITAGEQSNTIALTVAPDGSFALDVPLFAGDNHITVSGIYAGTNTSCSQTITITSLTDLALFRAQLTWDGDTDMNLHLVRPSGGYSNGGSGADDCNFVNCKVGLEGTGSNSIDWGTTGIEDDDPKLDVDCISCGNGIENIWMNQISEDGQYKVYVDAFGGSETDVTVTISILGTAVGQVNCGSMASGSVTDSCFVGTITWSGGTSGSGSFTPSGATASDF